MVGHPPQEGTPMSSPFEKDEKDHGTNRSAPVTRCDTCGGDRYVTVRLRAPEQTEWMREHNIKPSTTSMYDEVAGCPDCNPQEIVWRRHDGTVFRTLDPAAVRQLLIR